MIVFTIQQLDDFISLIPKAVTEEIYFTVERDKGDLDNPGKGDINVILHFIGVIGEHGIGLYQTSLNFPRSLSNESIYEEMKKAFIQTEIKLIRGKITEMFFSVSA